MNIVLIVLTELFKKISFSGYNDDQDAVFSDKLITRNRFSFFCAVFSFLYLLFFSLNGLWIAATSIFLSVALFTLSIILNKLKAFKASSGIILLATNYSVFANSIIFGFESGFHLYLITSPLIVYLLFGFSKSTNNAFAIFTYCFNFIIIYFFEDNFQFLNIVKPDLSATFYVINFILTIFILMVLLYYFLINNRKINSLLILKNEELVARQLILENENEQRRLAEQKLSASLEAKNFLLAELHHRVKNNLAVITSIMELQRMYTTNESNLHEIFDNKNRIKTIAMLHEKAYNQTGIVAVNMADSLREVISYLKLSVSNKNIDFEIHQEIENIQLEFDKVLPIALIVNELVSELINNNNSLQAKLRTELKLWKENGKIYLNYSDNSNAKKDHGLEKPQFSRHFIEILASQIYAKIVFNLNQNFNFSMSFLS